MDITKFLHVEINIFGIVVLAIMLATFYGKNRTKSATDQFIFELMIICNMVILLVDGITYYLEGNTSRITVVTNYICMVVYYILQPSLYMLWLFYCDYKLNEDTKRLKKRIIWYILPFAINLVLSLISPFVNGKLYFFMDANNNYVRGEAVWVSVALTLVYFIWTVALVIENKIGKEKFVDKSMYKYIFIFPIAPIIALLIQMFVFGVQLLWLSVVLSCLIIFVTIQNSKITTDALTGLNNRRQLNKYIDNRVGNLTKGQKLYLIMSDMDNFKTINDTYGHMEGDKALLTVTEALKECCDKKNNIIVRYGGDEFCIVGICGFEEEVAALIDCINSRLRLYNAKSGNAYNLALSMGYTIYGAKGEETVDSFVTRADREMYAIKASRKE